MVPGRSLRLGAPAGPNRRHDSHEINYDSFGNIVSETNPSASDRFKYTGREYDDLTDLYYYRARWYDATTGKFLSEDPLGFAAGDYNLSRYVGNQPTLHTDPTGLWWWDADYIQYGLGGLFGFYGGGVAFEGWTTGLAVTADGLIPFADPFEEYYDSNDPVFSFCKTLVAVSRDLLVMRFIPNLGMWAKNPIAYEVGSTTLPRSVYTTAEGMSVIERGNYLISQYGWKAALLGFSAPSEFTTTIPKGLTPGGWIVVIVTAELLDHFCD